MFLASDASSGITRITRRRTHDDNRTACDHRGLKTNTTGSRAASARTLPAAVKVNTVAMVVAIAAILWQIAAGVDYPTVPPGPIILAIAAAIVVLVRAIWARVVGIVVPLFLIVGRTIAAMSTAYPLPPNTCMIHLASPCISHEAGNAP